MQPEDVKEEEAKAKEQDGTQNELHKLCFFKFRAAQERLTTFPEEATHQDANGDLPIHIALCNSAPLPLISDLLAAYPDSAWHKNKHGKLPLHLCCEHWSKLPVVQAIKYAYPAAVNATDNYGEQPVNFARKHAPDGEILEAVKVKEGVTPGKVSEEAKSARKRYRLGRAKRGAKQEIFV